MSIVKGTAGDINPEFLERLSRTFKQPKYEPGKTLDELAYEQGQRNVIDWIIAHARSPSFN